MSPRWVAPPAAERCLVSSYASRGASGQKGGTIIEGAVLDLGAHEERMRCPASYRPAECRCGGVRLHLHGLRERVVRGSFTVVTVVVFLCAKCAATWRVLPAFLARQLWHTWETVESTLKAEQRQGAPKVPVRTRQRWQARLGQAAAQALAAANDAALSAVAKTVSLEANRQALVDAFAAAFPGGALLARLAELLHRLAPGVRLM